MQKLALAVALLSLAAVYPAHAGQPVPPCCACVEELDSRAVLALFCASPTNVDEAIAADEQCSQLEGQFICTKAAGLQSDETARQDVSQSCVAELRAQDIICPQAAAPALDTRALGALAGLLALLGAWALRRRAYLS